jgi:hypothetical protein
LPSAFASWSTIACWSEFIRDYLALFRTGF